MAYFQLKRLFSSLVFAAITHSCQSSHTEAWLILYVGGLPVKKKITGRNKPANTPPPTPLPPDSFRTRQSECRAESHDSTRLSFLITNEGVFSKWIGVGGIGGNWRIIWRIHIFGVHLLPFCFLTHVGLFGRRRKTQKSDCFPLYAMHGTFCVHLNPLTPNYRIWLKKSNLKKCCIFVSGWILTNSHLTNITQMTSLNANKT